MDFIITSLYPHEWRKLTIEEDDRETLVRSMRPTGLLGASVAAGLIAEIATEHGLQNEVQISIDAGRMMIFLHYSGKGPVEESHYELAKAIDNKLGLSNDLNVD
jgi:hypothetical protein